MNIKKLISVFTTLCFLFSVITSNLSAAQQNNNLLSNNVSLSFNNSGKITEIADNQSNLLVVNIQDLHSNKSVQSNINKILQDIDNQYKIKNIFVEGGYGDIDISWINKIKNIKLRDDLAEKLLSMGRLTGAEYFAYKTNRPNILKGLDNEQIHKENLTRLSEIIDKQDLFNAELKKIKSDITYISSKYSSKNNLRLNKLVEKYTTNKIDSKKFYTLLFKLVNKINNNPQNFNNLFAIDTENFHNINKYLSINLDNINNKRLSIEMNAFLIFVKTRLSFNAYKEVMNDTNNFKDTDKLIQHIYSISNTYKINLAENYPTLNIFLNNKMLVNTINPIELLNEERVLLNNLRQAFSKNETEYEISFLTDFYAVFRDFFTNKLTANNYEYFASKEQQFINIYSKYSIVNRISRLSDNIKKLEQYYAVNNQRNSIFLNNILNDVEVSQNTTNSNEDIFKQAQEIIVVISGGYHTKGLNQLLSDKKISYVTITPMVSSDISKSEQEYINIIKEQLIINTNALSFTIASSTNEISQFNNLINAGIELLGGVYSQDVINKVVNQMKSVVKSQISVNYTDIETVISIDNKKITLANINGKIENKTGSMEISKPASITYKSFITNLFEANPSISFANGLSYKLRNIEKYNVKEIDGIDLAVIARLPSFIQDYFYTKLSDELKQQLTLEEEQIHKQILKENDKLPSLYKELNQMLIEQIIATKDFEKLNEELLPSFVKIINSRLKDTDEFITPLQNNLSNLLKKTDLTKIQISYVLSLLKYINIMTGQHNDISTDLDNSKFDQESSLVFTKKIQTINKQEPHLLTISTPMLDKIITVKNDVLRDKLLVFYHIVIAPFVEAPMINQIFDNTAKINIPLESSILPELFLKKHIEFQDNTEDDIIEQQNLREGLYSVIDSMAYTYKKLYSRTHSHAIASFAAKITNIISHSKWNKEQIYISYEDESDKIIPFQQKGKTPLQKAIITVIVVVVLLTGGIYGYNTIQTIQKSNIEITQMQQDLRISQADSFDSIINTWLTNDKLTDKDIALTNNLKGYIDQTIKTDTEESFYLSLFQIRKDITSLNNTLMPSMDDSYYVDIYRYVLNKIDGIVNSNLNDINDNRILKTEFKAVYSADEIEFLTILSQQYSNDKLTEIVQSNQNIKYRFYAYMLLAASDDYQYNKNDFTDLLKRDEIIKYLQENYFLYTKDNKGSTTDISFTDVKNRYEWQVLCGMAEFLINDTDNTNLIKENFKYVFDHAEIVKESSTKVSNAGLLYSFQSDTNMVAPIFVAAHEMSHIKYLNILGWSLETIATKTAELYAYLGEENVVNDFGLSSQIKVDKSITDINNDTDEYDIAFIVMMQVKDVCGINSLNLLQESIIEYISSNNNTTDVQITLKDVLTIFANKVADKEVTEGTIKEEDKANRIEEIINKLFIDTTKNDGASILGPDFKKSAHVWEWIYNLPFSAAISSVIKRVGIKSFAKKTGTDPFELKKLFNKQIGEGKNPIITILFDSLLSIISIAGISYGFITGILPIIVLSSVIYSITRGLIFSVAHISTTDTNAKKKLFVAGTLFTASAIAPAITVLILCALVSVSPIIPIFTTFILFISGQNLSSKIHQKYNSIDKNTIPRLSYVEQVLKKGHKDNLKRFNKIQFTKADNGIIASYRHNFFQKPEKNFIPTTNSKEEMYIRIKGLITDYIKTDLKQNVHYYTKFYKKDVRKKILNPLFEDNTNLQYGYVLKMLKTKINNNDRTFRFWSCGSATGEELRTFVWLIRQALENLGEDTSKWKLDFVGTDNNKITAKIASEFTGEDTVDGTGEKITVNTKGFNIEYMILNHVDDVDLENWLIWQKELGGFDLICQLNNPTPTWEQDALVKNVINDSSIYIHHDKIYDHNNKEIVFNPANSADVINTEIHTNKSENTLQLNNDGINFTETIVSFFKSIISIFTKPSQGVFQKIGVIYRNISVNEINKTNNLFRNFKQNTGTMLYENVFVIKDAIDTKTAESLNFQPLGIKINDNNVYISNIQNVIYLYVENINYDNTVNMIKNNTYIQSEIIKHINKANDINISLDKADFISAKIVESDNDSISQAKDLLTIYTKSNIYQQQEILAMYSDITTRYGFAVRESIFRYIDNFKITDSEKADRIKDFENIIDQQKNISCQLALDYDVYHQLTEDFGLEQFNLLLERAKSKNISIHILIADKTQKENVAGNKSVSGFIEMIDDTTYLITDSLTNEDVIAKFEQNCDTVEKIISAINNNIAKQPIIFKNSYIEKAINTEQDNTLSGKLKDIFALGRITNIISEVKEKRLTQKVADTYSVESLAKSFTEQDNQVLLELYKKWSADNLQQDYEQLVKILTKNDKLKQYFDFNKYASENYEQTVKNNGAFIEQIIFRVAMAQALLKYGKEIGLKHKEYEAVLTQTLKSKLIENKSSTDIDKSVADILSANYDDLTKEKMLKKYLDDNITTLTERALSKTQEKDIVAVNTLILLIPYAEVADIEIDIVNISLTQHDLRLTKEVLSAA